MGVDRGQRYKLRPEQPGFAVLDLDVAVDELYFLCAQAFHFPAEQRDAGLEFVFKEIIVGSFLVADDCGIVLLG